MGAPGRKRKAGRVVDGAEVSIEQGYVAVARDLG